MDIIEIAKRCSCRAHCGQHAGAPDGGTPMTTPDDSVSAGGTPVRVSPIVGLPNCKCGLYPRVIPDDSHGRCHVFCVCDEEHGVSAEVGQLETAKQLWRDHVKANDERIGQKGTLARFVGPDSLATVKTQKGKFQ